MAIQADGDCLSPGNSPHTQLPVAANRRVTLRAHHWIAGLGLTIAIGVWTIPASAFELQGHKVIEATAYKRLLALDAVPGTGPPEVSGRTLLAALIAMGVLAQPPCFDRDNPGGDCGPAQRLDMPLRYWPTLGAGEADLVLDRQLGQRGQCQHFMAPTRDGLTPIDPRFGVPGGLVTTAYLSCIRTLGAVFDGILRDPRLAQWRIVGPYVFIHALEDSFSAAHVNRDPHFKIVHLLSWTLIDWPTYALHGRASFPAATHHAVSDHRDYDYLRWDARTSGGRLCRDLHNPYAFPEECLTDRAKAAADAVVDFLILTYRLRTRASAAGRQASLFSPVASGDAALWMAFVREHLASVAVAPELPSQPRSPLPRANLFIGAQGLAGSHLWGAGLWGARFIIGPATPFLLGITGGGGYSRMDSVGQLGASAQLSLLVPLVRRFTIGVAPAGMQLVCDTGFESCHADAVATLGVLLVPVGSATWLGVEGPRWSWTERTIGPSWVGLSIGWSHEEVPRFEPPRPEAAATWDPPRPDEVRSYRHARSTKSFFLATTVASRPNNAFVGGGLDCRWDRDYWGQRTVFAPEVQLEIDSGRIERSGPGGSLAVAPTLRVYLIPDRIALTVTPALIRFGSFGDHAVAVDVAGRAGIALDLGHVELGVDSPPLSYVSRALWNALPITMRLGLQFD